MNERQAEERRDDSGALSNPALAAELDRVVAACADRVQADPEADCEDLLAGVDPAHREGLERCVSMIRAGVVQLPGSGQALGPGVVLDGFRIERELGRGGMAVVYLAVQEDLDRKVALKVLRPGLAAEPRHVDRFRREALAIAKLDHPNIVDVHAVGNALGHHYIAMEYVGGANLAEALAALPPAESRTPADLAVAAGAPALAEGFDSFERALAALLAPVARAIGVAHELGLVHRDVKPSNILIHTDGRAVVADFGLAKGEGDPGLSLTGEPLGTPFYMSPEQAQASEASIDHRTDVYSLGVSLYEGLTGRRPFEGETLYAVLEAIRTRLPELPREVCSGLSADAQAVVLKAMERDPGDRYPTALDLYADLRALAEGRPTAAGAQVGGGWRRFRRAIAQGRMGHPVEFRSHRHVLGLPLVHVHLGPRRPGAKLRVAKGWLAVGEIAIGGVAFGAMSCGLLSWGGLAAGGLAFGGAALGLLSWGGLALGLGAFGGVAVGYVACGGLAVGKYAVGGATYGAHRLVNGQPDPELVEYFEGWLRFFGWARAD